MTYHSVYLHHSIVNDKGDSEYSEPGNADQIEVWVALESEESGIIDAIEEFTFPVNALEDARDKAKTLSKAYEAEIEEY